MNQPSDDAEDGSPDESSLESVGHWLDDLRRGKNDAATYLWERYFEKLEQVAGGVIGAGSRGAKDGEDVALSVMASVCRRAQAGRIDWISHDRELWCLLIAMTHDKAVEHLRREGRQKRGGGKLRQFSNLSSRDLHSLINTALASDPSPETVVTLKDQLQQFLALLRNDELRQLAQMVMDGLKPPEIAEKMNIGQRSVYRKLALIKESWTKAFANSVNHSLGSPLDTPPT
ncbi:MAG: ECF-type sigma factor [Planctomycetaceae bacterium]